MTAKVFEDDKLHDQKEVAPKIGKSEAWLERQRWAGGGPRYIKVGRAVRYSGKDLNDWLESQTRQRTPGEKRVR